MRTICTRLNKCYSEPFSVIVSGLVALYVCNCNGLRQRDVAQAIEAGATRPKDIFASNQCAPQCAKCVCEMRQMIQDTQAAFALAAE
ncbi:BFD-like [2Fe-2S] binding domain protein [compost metagenome]